ncbi:MAG: hypothetical protein DRJ05_04395 [Bacteroidetes bacterium]|nr:MAG: hypothetical protein DRJ05_04395 [Bacteroidota bacterium]
MQICIFHSFNIIDKQEATKVIDFIILGVVYGQDLRFFTKAIFFYIAVAKKNKNNVGKRSL